MPIKSVLRYLLLLIVLAGVGIIVDASLRQPDIAPPPAPTTQFWIGEVGPQGPISIEMKQYPFVCTSFKLSLGQSLIDNQDGIGNAVFRESSFVGPWIWSDPIGYSRDCSVLTRVDYYYFSTAADEFVLLDDRDDVPSDVEKITVNGKEVDFVVRAERGVINRFLYNIAMLAPFEEETSQPDSLNNSAWNSKLVYKFQGGVGIGHWQGNLQMTKGQSLYYEALKRGYAVASSSGTSSGTHYNLTLAEETALMLKKHFSETYGKPKHTIGIGGSGGAIQQYLLAQNNPEILDGLIPQLSYPDMLTQISYVGDCDLLERYFDQKYHEDPESKWGDWQYRKLIEGINASSSALESSRNGISDAPSPGASTCSYYWRGQIENVMNPYWKHPAYDKIMKIFKYPKSATTETEWTHWADLANIYPKDETGYAQRTWDNVGVQYGLQTLRNHQLSIDEFLELNACIGSWKSAKDQSLGRYPWDPNGDKSNPDPWDSTNMQLNPECKTGRPAPRIAASETAIEQAIKTGQLFLGNIDLPIIDVRWYLDPYLDIHHALGSFNARARITKARGNHNNQIIWFASCTDENFETLKRECPFDPTAKALDLLEEWLTTGVKPKQAVDACVDHEGEMIYAGDDAWNGVLDNQPNGTCTKQFPIHSTPRIIAGEPMTGDVLKCKLKTVAQAIQDGDYGNIPFTVEQLQRLHEIFPGGVCDYKDE